MPRTKIITDHENPEWTDADFKRAVPFSKLPDSLQKSIKKGMRGRPVGRTKKAITVSLDTDVIEKLRASGDGWQTRLNDLVRSAIGLIA